MNLFTWNTTKKKDTETKSCRTKHEHTKPEHKITSFKEMPEPVDRETLMSRLAEMDYYPL